MNMLDKITADEYAYFGARCNAYMDDECNRYPYASIRDIVLHDGWANNKNELYKLFGEELILSKEIEIVAEVESLRAEMAQHLDTYTAMSRFIRQLHSKLNMNEIKNLNNNSYALYYAILHNITDFTLATNEIDDGCRMASGNLPKGIKISFTKGAKLMRIISKIAQAYDLVDEFEAFRLEHSQILNQKKLTGKLCLSIHPLDFSTMSDNENGWGSCMSWRDWGKYRQGTVEMMNSPCVIVAYLEDKLEQLDEYGYTWNSKKWRELFLVDQKCLVGIKGYPYQSPALEEIVMEWLKELAEKNWGVKYSESYEYQRRDTTKQGNHFDFYTNYMYNDFGFRNHKHTHLFAENVEITNTEIAITYSGPNQCMACGQIHCAMEHEGRLCCDDCSPARRYCADCGDKIFDGDDYYELDGDILCPYCYEHNAQEDIFDEGEMHWSSNFVWVVIVPKDASSEVIKEMEQKCTGNGSTGIEFPIRYSSTIFMNDKWQEYFEEKPRWEVITKWSGCYYITEDKLKDKFFELDWVLDHIGERKDLQDTHSAMRERISILQ